MRRALILTSVVAGTLAGLGCTKATRGRCDCLYNPENAVLAQPGNPYPVVGPAIGANGEVVPNRMAPPPPTSRSGDAAPLALPMKDTGK